MKKNKRKVAAIDFETYYSALVSIARMSTWQYVNHPEFSAFLVAIYSPDIEFVGNPENFDWRSLDGYTLVAHNASFDQRVFERLQELGIIPTDIKVEWECTADMCVYYQYQRNLKGAAKAVLGAEMSKEVRDNMKGKTWDDIVAEDRAKETLVYAMDDARYCYEVWEKLEGGWPAEERRLSVMTRAMAWEGLPPAIKTIRDGIDHLERQLFDAKQRLPWYDEIDPDTRKTYAVYSKKALAIECKNLGIPPPKSLDKNNEDFLQWNAEYGNQITFAADMQAVQRINKHLKGLRAMEERLNAANRISYNLKYFGADATGRWSGDGGFNIQNLPRAPQYGVDLRSCICAGKGKKLLIVDLAQIEARLTAWLAGDYEFLEQLGEGMSPYEAHARLTMGWTGGKLKDEDPGLYMLAKVRVLQLGYGSGWFKFAETVKSYGQQDLLDLPFTKADEIRFKEFASAYQPGKATMYPTLSTFDRRQWVNAYIQVADFRSKNPGITAAWKAHDWALKDAAKDGEDYSFEIPSGRELRYTRCRIETDGITAATQEGSVRRTYTYGANLFQNKIQATARDIFAHMLVKIDEAGYKIVMHVHDEVVIEVDTARAKEGLKEVIEIMSTAPEWAQEVPLAAEGIITKEYTK